MSAQASARSDPLSVFSEGTRRWFEDSFEVPTPAQAGGWPAIASGRNTLICAPTGSGKTLAAFLWGIDSLARRDRLRAGSELGERDGEEGESGRQPGVRLLYVSPLKALSYDVERNLRAPLRGIGAAARGPGAKGSAAAADLGITVGLRTGDTPQRERQAMRRTPPDILITTPESFYLMITSQAREILTGVEAVIVDEIHAVAQSKRGAHLALTLERLAHQVKYGNPDAPGREAEEAAGIDVLLYRVPWFHTGERKEHNA